VKLLKTLRRLDEPKKPSIDDLLGYSEADNG
jgi:hypothetical protein